MIKDNIKLIHLSIVTIALLSLIGSLGSYFTQLGNERVEGPLIFTIIICSVVGTLSHRYLRYSILLIVIAWIIYFKMYIPIVISIALFIIIFKIGSFVSNFFNHQNKSLFINYCIGHTLLGFFLWLILRFSRFDAVFIYRVLGLILIIFSLYHCIQFCKKKNLILIRKILNNKFNLLFNQSVLILIICLGIYSTLYSFYFDDINGYLYAPLRVYYEGGFLFGPERPGFMTNMSALSLGYGSLFSSFFGFDRTLFIFIYKFFHSASYIIAIITFSASIKTVISKNISGILVLLLGLLPLIVFEITGNYADYYVLLMSFYITYISICIIFSKFSYNNNFFSLNSLIIGLFLIVSLKNLPYLLAFFFVILILSILYYGVNVRKIFSYVIFNYKLILICILFITSPTLVLFIDNYVLTGNPTFPGGNGLWKSPFFDKKGIVAGRFHFPNMPDGSTFIQLFSFTPQASQLFSSGNSYFPIYGVFSQTILYLIPFMLIYSFFKGHNYNRNNHVLSFGIIFILLSLITFVVITNTVGPQHRYFFGINTFLFTTFAIILSNIQWSLFYVSAFIYFKWFFFSIAVFTFFGNGIETPPFKITSDRILTSSRNEDKWLSKKVFYDKVNDYIKDDKSIMLYYLQDKFFINSKFVYELDWYDYPLLKSLNTIWSSDKFSSTEDKINAIKNDLCEKNFKYFILSKDVKIYDSLFRQQFLSEEIFSDKNHSLLILNCP